MRPINQCLNTKLAAICQQAIRLDELNHLVNQFLPDALKEYYSVGSFNKGCLVLIAKDSAWASQMRYSLPELRDKLRSEGKIHQLTSIKLSIATKPRLAAKQKPTLALSTQAKTIILEESNKCLHHPLKIALQKLARNLRKN